MSKQKFTPWKPGDAIAAARLNERDRVLERLDNHTPADGAVQTTASSASRQIARPQIKFVRMTETIGPSQYIDNQWYDRDGIVQTWSRQENDFIDTDERVHVVIDPEGGHVADVDQVVPCVSHHGKLVAISWQTVRHAKTCRDPSNKYPEPSDDSCVFPIKFVKIEYVEDIETTDYTLTELFPQTDHNDDYVCNIRDDIYKYIPEDAVIWVYRVTGQWFTYFEGSMEESSSSSSSSSSSTSSLSSSSSTSTSQSSTSTSWSWQSVSSMSLSSSLGSSSSSISISESSESSSSRSVSDSSESSSSRSVSDSSQSSSSVSVSEVSLSSSSSSSTSMSFQSESSSSSSSDSESSLSESSVSRSESSQGWDCVDVVTCLEFDEETCILTYQVKQICFPKSLGITIEDSQAQGC